MYQAYMALLRADGTEPDPASGYRRTFVGTVETPDLQQLLREHYQVAFPDVLPPGYGTVTAVALFTQAAGGIPVDACNFPESRDVHPGVVPVIHRGRLWMGVDVQASARVLPGTSCAAGGIR